MSMVSVGVSALMSIYMSVGFLLFWINVYFGLGVRSLRHCSMHICMSWLATAIAQHSEHCRNSSDSLLSKRFASIVTTFHSSFFAPLSPSIPNGIQPQCRKLIKSIDKCSGSVGVCGCYHRHSTWPLACAHLKI